MRSESTRRGVAVRTVALLSAVLLGLAGLAFDPAPARAHVSADPTRNPPRDGFGQISLLVPNESASAATDRLVVTFPDGVDVTSVRTLPVAGWSATIERAGGGTTGRVASITWTADSPEAGIGPTEYGIFSFSGGRWPDVESVSLPTDQGYDDGTVVSWNEIALDSGSDPDHPAPLVTLGPATSGHGDDHRAQDDSAAAADPHEVGDSGSGWKAVSVIALVIALASLGWSAVLTRRRTEGR